MTIRRGLILVALALAAAVLAHHAVTVWITTTLEGLE
jgi:hypothetical protein